MCLIVEVSLIKTSDLFETTMEKNTIIKMYTYY